MFPHSNTYQSLAETQQINFNQRRLKKKQRIALCPICMLKKKLTPLECGHKFCKDCQKRWPERCATCRQIIIQKEKKLEETCFTEEVDVLTQDYLTQYTQPCPGCGIPCVHVGGCLFVTCASCKYRFIWRGKKEGSFTADLYVFFCELATLAYILSITFIIYLSIMLIKKNFYWFQ